MWLSKMLSARLPLMLIFSVLVTNLFTEIPVAAAQTESSEKKSKPSVLPSTLVNYIHVQNYLNPDLKQHEIARPLLEHAKAEELSDHEEFFLAQLNFMAFRAPSAYEKFEKFVDRSDWYGWVARERQSIMDARALENFERLEYNTANWRERFRYRPEFAFFVGFGEKTLCTEWIKNAEYEKASNLAIDSIAVTPRDAPYLTLTLVRDCFVAFEQSGRTTEAIELARQIKNDLKATLEKRLAERERFPEYDPDLFENIIDSRWYGRSRIAMFNYQSNEIEKIIVSYEKFLACQTGQSNEDCTR